MRWKVPRIWEGEDVYIIGGGPSIITQFNISNDVVKKVREGGSLSLYSPYMKSLHDKHVIGVNAAFLLGNWIDIAFFGDRSFFKKYYKQLATFPGFKVTCNSKYSQDYIAWIKVLPWNRGRRTGISNDPKTVSWNHNSGAAAISVAANAGAKRIILIGFDMKLTEEQQWWHNLYAKGKPHHKNLPFNRHLRGFSQIAKDARKRGIEIINANPDSAITEFRKINIKDVL